MSRRCIESMAAKLAPTRAWRLRQKLGTMSEIISTEIVPIQMQIEERRYTDAADYLLAAYRSAKDLIALVDREFPEARRWWRHQNTGA